MMAGAWGVAGGFAAAEVCAPLLVLCWLCCWPADDSSDSSSGKHPQKPVVTREAGSRQRSNEWPGKCFGSSAVSLHLPSTSGTKQSLSAHRSHEEIRGPRKSHHEVIDDTRYHSAPSVIDEVLHRRDWERSSKDLYIPLKSFNNTEDNNSSNENTEEITNSNEQIIERTCKKHYTNIKSSRKKQFNKELLNKDIKDSDATEDMASFYIGETSAAGNISNETSNDKNTEEKVKMYKPKESKQTLNESIKSKEIQKQPIITLPEFQISGFEDTNTDVSVGKIDADRSGAVHHTVESRSSLYNAHTVPIPPPSVETVGYESDASYLAEDDVLGAWRLDRNAATGSATVVDRIWGRARHGSAGDVLAPTLRPHSAALSESDLDYELEECDEPPPAYDQLHLLTAKEGRKETAI